MAQKATAYDVITDRIIAALEDGQVPWHKPWRAADAPRSLSTGKPYRGINILMLQLTAQAKGYDSPYWLTYRQAEARGGTVRKGEKGTPVVLWKRTERENKSTGEKRPSVFLRYFTVFNSEQCDGVEVPEWRVDADYHEPCEAAEAIVGEYLFDRGGPSLDFGGDSAHYVPSTDHVQMPRPEGFTASHRYYSTLFHELVHSTGHESRLDRTLARFGSGDYSKEELVAEIGACFLTSTADLEVEYDQSAAYITSWLSALRDDPKLIVTAAAAAQKAADLILGTTFDAPSTPEPALATA